MVCRGLLLIESISILDFNFRDVTPQTRQGYRTFLTAAYECVVHLELSLLRSLESRMGGTEVEFGPRGVQLVMFVPVVLATAASSLLVLVLVPAVLTEPFLQPPKKDDKKGKEKVATKKTDGGGKAKKKVMEHDPCLFHWVCCS